MSFISEEQVAEDSKNLHERLFETGAFGRWLSAIGITKIDLSGKVSSDGSFAIIVYYKEREATRKRVVEEVSTIVEELSLQSPVIFKGVSKGVMPL